MAIKKSSNSYISRNDKFLIPKIGLRKVFWDDFSYGFAIVAIIFIIFSWLSYSEVFEFVKNDTKPNINIFFICAISVITLVIATYLRKKFAEVTISRVLEELKPIGPKLAARRRALIYKDYYGHIKYDRWIDELDNVLNNIINPKIGDRHSARFAALGGLVWLDSVISKNWDAEVRSAVDPTTIRSPYEFEQWCAEECHRAGWDAYVTKASGDFGADVVAQRGNKIIVIQSKLYTGSVPISAVQEISGARLHYTATHAIVVSTSKYTRAAHKLAVTNDVTLLSATELYVFMKNY
ncbi:restriction endonuclease [Camelimonas lactis]|uniref:Restriction endonuclease n=1 Tax=Camelimonas lactis TaxID=659006 RepID=A0A4R2GFZ3_9HYPH|nr:restriction endonuclease [Camelimonas lactis]TCO07169.1 restriction endonuclease [Camelimonas lactis]